MCVYVECAVPCRRFSPATAHGSSSIIRDFGRQKSFIACRERKRFIHSADEMCSGISISYCNAALDVTVIITAFCYLCVDDWMDCQGVFQRHGRNRIVTVEIGEKTYLHSTRGCVQLKVIASDSFMDQNSEQLWHYTPEEDMWTVMMLKEDPPPPPLTFTRTVATASTPTTSTPTPFQPGLVQQSLVNSMQAKVEGSKPSLEILSEPSGIEKVWK